MIFKKNELLFAPTIICMTFLPSFAACAQSSIDAIPYEFQLDERTGEIELGSNQILINAPKGTDIFTDATGKVHADNAPRLLFEPTGDFDLSGHIKINLDAPYDGAGFSIYGDKNHWAKLIFERFKDGRIGVASTVVNHTGDDAYHGFFEPTEIYLKLIRRGHAYGLSTSPDGEVWSYKRSFSLDLKAPVKVGFLAQSPIGENSSAIFSKITFVAPQSD